MWVIGGLLVVVLLAAAAFVGGRLLNGEPIAGNGLLVGPGEPSSGGRTSMSQEGGDEPDVETPEELPDTQPDTSGLFVKKEDNVITVGTGMTSVAMTTGKDGVPEVESDFDGPEVEIVVTRDTKIYRDSTMDNQVKPPKQGETIKMTIEEAEVEDIGSNAQISVWGRKSGDRIMADIILFSAPGIVVQ
jgi:hypothetical protein